MAWTIVREHSICCGHRVYGHEGKCKNLHGHNYKFEMTVEADELDAVGRVVDFSVIKDKLCQWLEDRWDHKMLLWVQDPFLDGLHGFMDIMEIDPLSVVPLPFNPTAENLAMHFVEHVAPVELYLTGVRLVQVRLWETDKCSAIYRIGDNARKHIRRSERISVAEPPELLQEGKEKQVLEEGIRSSEEGIEEG